MSLTDTTNTITIMMSKRGDDEDKKRFTWIFYSWKHITWRWRDEVCLDTYMTWRSPPGHIHDMNLPVLSHPLTTISGEKKGCVRKSPCVKSMEQLTKHTRLKDDLESCERKWWWENMARMERESVIKWIFSVSLPILLSCKTFLDKPFLSLCLWWTVACHTPYTHNG